MYNLCHHKFARFMALVQLLVVAQTVAAPHLLAQASQSSEFSDSLKVAQAYVIQLNDSASVRRGINLNTELIARFPDEPGIYRAKLNLMGILLAVPTNQNLSEASRIAEDVAKNATVESDSGREILLEYLKFQIIKMQGRRNQNLDHAETLMKDYEAWAERQERKLFLPQAWTLAGHLQIDKGDSVGAVRSLLTHVEEIQNWGAYYDKLRREDARAYEEITARNTEMINLLGTAIIRSDDPSVVQLVSDAKVVLTYESIRKAIAAWPLYHPEKTGATKNVPSAAAQLRATIVPIVSPILRASADPKEEASTHKPASQQPTAQEPEIAFVSPVHTSNWAWPLGTVGGLTTLIVMLVALRKSWSG